jgi:hypothetical protein
MLLAHMAIENQYVRPSSGKDYILEYADYYLGEA